MGGDCPPVVAVDAAAGVGLRAEYPVAARDFLPRTDPAQSATVPAGRLWVHPDCGLKTRSYTEIPYSLTYLVTAARNVRAEVGPATGCQALPGSFRTWTNPALMGRWGFDAW